MKKKEKLAIIRKHYPKAKTTIDSVNQYIHFIENQLDLDVTKVMLGDSICSDDVNNIQLPKKVLQFLGPFKMGGLNGFPFAGKTGMGAFASHVPDDGAVAIYYGPHVGITREGALGEIYRVGQGKASGCCGAAKAALSNLVNDKIIPNNVTELDYQMNVLEQILLNGKNRIVNASNPIKEATEVIYEAIDARIEELIAMTTYTCKYLLLFGGIHINGDWDMGSFSELRKFEIIDLKSGIRTSYLDELGTSKI